MTLIKSLNFAALAVLTGISSVALAVTPVDLLSEKTFPAFNNVLDPSAKPPAAHTLAALKRLSVQGKHAECADAAKILLKEKDLRGWIWRERLECSYKAAQTGKETLLRQALTDFASQRSLMREGPWSEALQEIWIRSELFLMEKDVKLEPTKTIARADETLLDAELLSKDQRAQIYLSLGDAALKAGNRPLAHWAFQAGKDVQATRGLLDRLKGFEETPDDDDDVALAAKKTPAPPTLEDEIDQATQDLLIAGKKAEAADRLVGALALFPGGKKAKKFRERLLEIYWTEFDKNDEEKVRAIREVLLKADAQRLAEWAGIAHRRGDDEGSLAFAEKALETFAYSPNSTTLTYVAARSSHFLGQTDKATRYYDRLVQYHGGTEEAAEALFRLGLLQLRAGNAPTAAQLFEKLLSTPNNGGRFELSAKYWRVRALQKSNSALAATEAEALTERFPFSYYGLRLRAEATMMTLEWPASEASPKEKDGAPLWLFGDAKLGWKRFLRLSHEGWLLEAQAELARIPSPAGSWAVWNWGKRLADASQFPPAIVAVNRAMENEETLRHPRYLAISYPNAYAKTIESEAAKQQLDADLVRSLIRQESAFGLKALSTSSAMGLMQMIPPTAQDVAKQMKLKVQIPDDMYRPEINVPMGTFYLRQMVDEFNGKVPLALAAYNAGPYRLKRWLQQRPETQTLIEDVSKDALSEIWMDELPWSETSFYVKAILRNVLLYRLLDNGHVDYKPDFWTDLSLSKTSAAK